MEKPERPSSGIERPEQRMKEVFAGVIKQRLREQFGTKTESERIKALLEGTEVAFREKFPGFDVTPMYDEIKKEDWSGREMGLANRVAEDTCSLLLSRYSPREVEDILRVGSMNANHWKAASDVLLYEVRDSYIVLHIPTTFARSVLQIGALFQQGLRELASRLSNEEELARVERITGRSEIVYDYQESLARAGWAISDVQPESHLAMASMPRDNFIKEYGSKEK